jgi:hypothetical protein
MFSQPPTFPPENSSLSSSRKLILAVVIFLVVAACSVLFLLFRNSEPSNRYQAVFLTNGQVYFGKVTHEGLRALTLEKVYYFQVKGSSSSTSSADDLALIKLGNEVHGPEDHLEITWNTILFIESLRTDSRVVKAIETYQNH